jgi:hypothetical protein
MKRILLLLLFIIYSLNCLEEKNNNSKYRDNFNFFYLVFVVLPEILSVCGDFYFPQYQKLYPNETQFFESQDISLALYVDRDIKLTLEVLQEICGVTLYNYGSCRNGKEVRVVGGTEREYISVQYSTNPINTTKYYLKGQLPYYRLIKVRSHWENGIAPKNCKFKITTEDL